MITSRPNDDEERHRREEKVTLENSIKTNRRAVLVVNARSRRGARYYSEAKRRLVEKGWTLDAAYPVHRPERLPEIVRQAISQGHKFIIVGGGDGTISSVVDHFAYTDVVFGILPLGTANSFARHLSIPLQLDAAVDVLSRGKLVDINLGRINADYFANGAAIGLPAILARNTPHGLKRAIGRAGYLVVASVRFLRYQSFQCALTYAGRSASFDAVEVRIANGGYQGGILVAEGASVESRDLLIQVIKGRSKWKLAKVWAARFGLASSGTEDIEVIRTPDILIDTVPRQYVSIDGEAVTQTPIRASVAREALWLMVPADRRDLA
jgi:YegS/Rv2252/BmrU family lipid kinase